jgi:hypothetical protein
LIAGEGADEDPLPPNGLNPHPMPNLPFGGIWNDADFVEHGDQEDNNNNVAPNLNNAAVNPGHVVPAAAAADNHVPRINTPPQSPQAHGAAQNLQPAIEAMESFNAMHNLVNDIITNLPSAIVKLDMENISGASFKLLDVSNEIGSEKKAMITIYSVHPGDFQPSKCIIQEIEEEHNDETSEFTYDPIDDHEFSDAMLTEPEAETDTLSSQTAPAKKKQKKIIRDVSEVRRSQRIAKICDGFKDKEAAGRAKDNEKIPETVKAPNILEERRNKTQPPSLAPSQLKSFKMMPLLHLNYPLTPFKPLVLTTARYLLVRSLWRSLLPHVTNASCQASSYFVLSV